MAALKRAGLFKVDGDADVAGFSNGSQDVIVTKSSENDYVIAYWREGDRLRGESIQLERVPYKFGDRLYFRDDYGCRCLVLYFVDGGFYSARTLQLDSRSRNRGANMLARAKIFKLEWRLTGGGGTPRARGAKRDRLLAELDAMHHPFMRSVKSERLIAEFEQRSRRRARGPARFGSASGPLSTRAALELGLADRGPMNTDSARTYLDWADAAHANHPIDSTAPLLLISDRPALDVRELGRRWELQPGEIVGAYLDWPEEIGESAAVVADLRKLGRPRLLLVPFMYKEPRMVPPQFVELSRATTTGRPRWYLGAVRVTLQGQNIPSGSEI